ncbi:hypothetical protein GUJ93_ZPchr0008g13609 [Zizania palustris]|uniref:F-box domain-containing protein n=1 Tax=Zizania palustris TaxID=103762 RepID=A0A8J5RXS8_ZIZPA|nr:hypothetical protein GUJ93_ZPchr0008g13609 [Zizania palustris]
MAFCDDLLVEILSRLPFKSLARFKCVSRSWRELITGGYMRGRLPLLTAGLFVHVPNDDEPRYATAYSGGGLEYDDMSFFPLVDTAKIVDACDGLLLYRSLAAASAMYVANPATRRWAALPVPRREAQLPVLAFDPCSSPHYYVVCFVAWQERGATVDASSLSSTTHYRGGVLHVLAYPDRVVLMDLATTMAAPCRLARLPEDVNASARLGHCRRRLQYVKCDGEQLRVWILHEDDDLPAVSSQWSLFHAVAVNQIVVSGGRWATDGFKFLAFHPDMADVVYLWSAGKLASCDLRKREITSVSKLGADEKEGERHVVRFWLLTFSTGLLNCLAETNKLQARHG